MFVRTDCHHIICCGGQTRWRVASSCYVPTSHHKDLFPTDLVTMIRSLFRPRSISLRKRFWHLLNSGHDFYGGWCWSIENKKGREREGVEELGHGLWPKFSQCYQGGISPEVKLLCDPLYMLYTLCVVTSGLYHWLCTVSCVVSTQWCQWIHRAQGATHTLSVTKLRWSHGSQPWTAWHASSLPVWTLWVYCLLVML